jgi:hypothetical protein
MGFRLLLTRNDCIYIPKKFVRAAPRVEAGAEECDSVSRE